MHLPQNQRADSPPAKPAALQQSSARLLIVDDEPALVQLAQALLTQLGYTVIAVTSSEEALSTFQAAPNDIDLLLTDQTMPGLTGIVLMRECRRLRPDLPVILCSGFSPAVNERSALAQGANAFLSKPIELDKLSRTIHDVLTRTGPET